MNYEIRLREAIKRINELENKDNVQKIIEFLDDLKFERITDVRRLGYAQKLRRIAIILGDKFLSPTERDIKNTVKEIMETPIQRGGDKYFRGKENHNTPSHLPSDNTVAGYQIAMKRFYKWLSGNRSYPGCVSWMKIGHPRPASEVKPENIVTREELERMVHNCVNHRDKAIISVLYDSGVRLGELLSIRIRDVKFDESGALLLVSGKTGVRQVRIIGDSIDYLRSWLEIHPQTDDFDAPVFCRIERPPYRKMEPGDIYTVFRKVLRRSGITRRIYPHLMRHT